MAGLPLRPSMAVIGAGIGVVLIAVPRFLSVPVVALLLVYAGLVIIAYIVAAVTVGDKPGELFRGFLIGVNAAMNWAVGWLVYSKLLGQGAGFALAIVLGVLTVSSVFGFVSRSGFYQGLLGYLNWLLPASWPVVAIGFTFFLFGLLGALALGLPGVEFFKLKKVVFDWKTGTLFTRGGVISNLNPIDTAFNMGNFAFVDAKYDDMAIDHESGHTLNLAVFGSVFHLVGTVDENAISGEKALSERLAESHVPNSARPLLEMWV
jgi:hypothetical protein